MRLNKNYKEIKNVKIRCSVFFGHKIFQTVLTEMSSEALTSSAFYARLTEG